MQFDFSVFGFSDAGTSQLISLLVISQFMISLRSQFWRRPEEMLVFDDEQVIMINNVFPRLILSYRRLPTVLGRADGLHDRYWRPEFVF